MMVAQLHMGVLRRSAIQAKLGSKFLRTIAKSHAEHQLLSLVHFKGCSVPFRNTSGLNMVLGGQRDQVCVKSMRT